MGDFRARLASFSLSLPLIVVVGFSAGCGDNTPPNSATGGSGGSSTGGAGGGSTGAGGTTDGGTGGTGGAVSTGGVVGAGGVGGGTGGVVGTGGIGGSTGGAVGTGGTTACYTTAFTAPTAGAVLTVSDDTDHTCADGFQYTVTITSGAPD